MNRVGFILKPQSTEAPALLADLVPRLHGRGLRTVVLAQEGLEVPGGAEVVTDEAMSDAIDIAVVLGGDGTMLRAASVVADHGIPILGINLGRLGFLTPFDPSEAKDAMTAALEGRLAIEERARLRVTHRALGGPAEERIALNDTVIHQGGLARLIDLEARLDGRLIASYRADGLIVCTPTGSTAYNLAAGGPILTPDQAAMVMTPICAHSLTARPLVVPQSGTVTVALSGGDDSRTAVVTVDGQWARSFASGDRIDITATAAPLRVFRSDKGYFDILREKLHWGARTER
ncbi:MAG TPA: NAD(+)/NADH kinase [Kofleriaceae bacterium]|nr:NAD(+)/NADH kinase [Kofleriaceae bacterium]